MRACARARRSARRMVSASAERARALPVGLATIAVSTGRARPPTAAATACVSRGRASAPLGIRAQAARYARAHRQRRRWRSHQQRAALSAARVTASASATSTATPSASAPPDGTAPRVTLRAAVRMAAVDTASAYLARVSARPARRALTARSSFRRRGSSQSAPTTARVRAPASMAASASACRASRASTASGPTRALSTVPAMAYASRWSAAAPRASARLDGLAPHAARLPTSPRQGAWLALASRRPRRRRALPIARAAVYASTRT